MTRPGVRILRTFRAASLTAGVVVAAETGHLGPAARRRRLGDALAAEEEEVEEEDRIREVDLAVAVDVVRFLAAGALVALEEVAEQGDGVGDVDEVVAVGVAASELNEGRRGGERLGDDLD